MSSPHEVSRRHVPRSLPLPRGAAPAGLRLHQLRLLAAPFRAADRLPDVSRCPPRPCQAAGWRFLPAPAAQAAWPTHWEELERGAWRFWNDPVEGIGPNGYLLRAADGRNVFFEGASVFTAAALDHIAGLGGHRRAVGVASPFLRRAVAVAGALRPGAGAAPPPISAGRRRSRWTWPYDDRPRARPRPHAASHRRAFRRPRRAARRDAPAAALRRRPQVRAGPGRPPAPPPPSPPTRPSCAACR